MACNFSQRPLFPCQMSENNLVCPMRMGMVEGNPEQNGNVFYNLRHSFRQFDDCFDYGNDRHGRSGSEEDILDLLPSDPFGMDIDNTFTAISGWLEDLEVDYSGYEENDDMGPSASDYELVAGLNFMWNKAIELQNLSGSIELNDDFGRGFDAYWKEKKPAFASCQGNSGSISNMRGISSFDNGIVLGAHQQPVPAAVCCDGDPGSPHAALPFALSYLGVLDLLSVERVCKSLKSTVQGDPLLWRSIHIDQQLNDKMTDEVLLQLTRRAQGNLQCLSLVECQRITDDGLCKVIESNPRITKLNLPGCTRLSVDGLINNMKLNKVIGTPGIKHLRIGGLFGVTKEHFEELKSLLSMDRQTQPSFVKPHFYRRGQLYISCDDDRSIDIEMCPKCQNFRLVYDCPADSCQAKVLDQKQVCRGCRLCVARCVQCGCCINDGEYEETFCLELLCSDCWKQLLDCQEIQEKSGSFSN